MKILRVLIALLLIPRVSGFCELGTPSDRLVDAPSSVISPPFRADVPRLPPPEIVPDGAAPLEAARLSGGVAAAAGFGLVGFSVVAGVSGPLGWAAALIYFGGLTAYLSQRRLDGKQDFPPTQARPKRDKSTFETPAEAPRKPGV